MFEKKKLSLLAEQQYRQARGTAHKLILQEARRHIQEIVATKSSQIQQVNKRKSEIEGQKKQHLIRGLSDHLVNTKLSEVSGVGPQRLKAIKQGVYRGRLQDLNRAQFLTQGIGNQTQFAIDQWVNKYQSQMDRLLTQPFPEKEQIEQKYEQKLVKLNENWQELDAEKTKWQERLILIEGELSWLDKVTASDFYMALARPDVVEVDINRYRKGMFGEWESPPDWFSEIMLDLPEQTISLNPVNTSDDQTPPPWDSKLIGIEAANDLFRQKNIKQMAFFGGLLLILCCCLSFLVMTINLGSIETVPPAARPTKTATTTLPATDSPTATTSPQPTRTPIPSRTPQPTPEPINTTAPTAAPSNTENSLGQLEIVLNRVNVRATPGISGELVGLASGGEEYDILAIDSNGNWYQIELSSGATGWVGSNVIRLIQAPDVEDSPTPEE